MELVKIQALKVKSGKPQHMVAGKVYEVTEDKAAILFKADRAVEAKNTMVKGKIYKFPESGAVKDFEKKD